MERWVGWLSSKGFAASGVAIVLMVLFLLVEIILRQFKISTLCAQEFTGYLLVFVASVSLAQVLRKNRHIRITVVVSHLPQRWQKVLELVTPFLALPAVVYMAFWTFNMSITSFQRMRTAETVFETPLFIPQVFIPIGFSLFALQFVVLITERIKKARVKEG